MALKYKGCLEVTCSAFEYHDNTLPFDAITNPTGYGVQNSVLNPSAFDTYTLSLWAPGNDYYSKPATVVIDLLALPLPTPDEDGIYTWVITPEMAGSDPVEDGVWFWEANVINSLEPQTAQGYVPFIAGAYAMVKEKLKSFKPGCESCKKGCITPTTLMLAINNVKCGYPCSAKDAQTAIDWIRHKAKSCC